MTFLNDEHVMRVIDRIISPLGRRCDESSPMVDARLPDGSRVNAIIPPLALDGPTITIRKFSKSPLTVDDLISFGTLTPEMAAFLKACVEARLNVVVSGGTGSGKTTLLNVLSGFIPDDERIITIEDSAELQLRQDHVVRWSRARPTSRAKARVAIRDLVHQRPAHAPRAHRRRRVPRRRGAGHAAGHEHGPRRLHDHGARQHAPRYALALGDDVS